MPIVPRSKIVSAIVAVSMLFILVNCDGSNQNGLGWGKETDLGKNWRVVRDPVFNPVSLAASPDVIVGLEEGAGVRVSNDGRTWKRVYLADHGSFDARKLTWIDSHFVAYGGAYHTDAVKSYLAVSTDGYNWTTADLPTEGYVNAVAKSPSGLVALMDDGTVLGSSDALTWTTMDSASEERRWSSGLAWADSVFVLCTQYGAILASATGADWEEWAPVGTVDQIHKLIWANGRFLGLSYYGGLMLSVDGRNWSRTYLGGADSYGLTDLTSHENTWVVTLSNGATACSTDGENWRISNVTAPLYSYGNYMAVWFAGRFIIGGTDFRYSEDGCEWQLLEQVARVVSFRDITWGDREYIAVSSDGVVMSSPDGESWNFIAEDTSLHFVSVAWSGDIYVAAIVYSDRCYSCQPKHSELYSSVDGVHWQRREICTNCRLTRVRWVNGRFFAMGTTILESGDGIDWKVTDWTDRPSAVLGIAYNTSNGQYVAVGEFGLALTSTNGDRWAFQDSGIHETMVNIVFRNDRFIGAGQRGGMMETSDGSSWSLVRQFYGGGFQVWDATTCGGMLIVVGETNLVVTTDDLKDWINHYPTVADSYTSVASNGQSIVAAGMRGSIVKSP